MSNENTKASKEGQGDEETKKAPKRQRKHQSDKSDEGSTKNDERSSKSDEESTKRDEESNKSDGERMLIWSDPDHKIND
ncbi:12009_t:CDS:2 [Racocetra persica]|uniref:12009_t:CDS:1 n=1 Tax=Racocetra persica TaxID=160502 RepID=A0ACA9LMM5_9GLOM|nr:12009_t:CDS:2 [Racocetra persica]